MEIPLAKEVKAGTRFPINTPNGMVEFCVVRFTHGRGDDKHLTTIDGTTSKQVVVQAHCSTRFKGNEFKGKFTMVMPLDDKAWAVRAEFLIGDEEFWEGAP